MTTLPCDEVHVWAVDLDQPPGRIGALEALLSPGERERAGRFVFPDDRRRFIVAHAALREALGAYLGKPAGELAFVAAARGKLSMAPEADAWLRFNLSHSRDAALIACARERDVGADIEWMRDDIEHADIVKRFFSTGEREEWEALPPSERREAFFHGWTRKEAYVKALGEGLSHPPDAYTVRLGPEAPAALLADTLRPGTEAGWRLHRVPAPPGYVATVAVAAAAGATVKMVPRQWGRKLP